MSDIEIRAVEESDVTSLRALFAGLSDRDRTLMKDDMSVPEAFGCWISDPGARFVALDEDTVVDIVVIVPGVAWSRHVAQLRIVVDPARRRCGIGRALARCDLVEAVSAGRTRLLAEVLADDDAAVALFTAVGFDPEALLKDQVRDHSGTMGDLLLLSHFVDHDWATMATTGLDELIEE